MDSYDGQTRLTKRILFMLFLLCGVNLEANRAREGDVFFGENVAGAKRIAVMVKRSGIDRATHEWLFAVPALSTEEGAFQARARQGPPAEPEAARVLWCRFVTMPSMNQMHKEKPNQRGDAYASWVVADENPTDDSCIPLLEDLEAARVANEAGQAPPTYTPEGGKKRNRSPGEPRAAPGERMAAWVAEGMPRGGQPRPPPGLALPPRPAPLPPRAAPLPPPRHRHSARAGLLLRGPPQARGRPAAADRRPARPLAA